MFAELKSNEDIQKSIVEYLGEDEKILEESNFIKSMIRFLLHF